MTLTNRATSDEINLDLIANDPSAVANGFRTISVDNLVLTGQTAPTQATVSSTSVHVKGSTKVHVYFDVTGATTGVILRILGGISGFGYMRTMAFTATAGLYGFTIGSANITGMAQGATGVTRFDDMFAETQLSANTGAATGVTVTVRTRFLTER